MKMSDYAELVKRLRSDWNAEHRTDEDAVSFAIALTASAADAIEALTARVAELEAIPGLSGLLNETHVVVPREPTPAMNISGGIALAAKMQELAGVDHTAVDPAYACYRAMIAAQETPHE
jgi:hypothetical protein